MKKRKHYTPIILMLLAIVAVLGFQLYWLVKNYNEEKRVLSITTNALFREAVNEAQIAKLKLDTNTKFRVTSPRRAMGMVDVIRRRLDIDTVRARRGVNSAMVIAVDDGRRDVKEFERTLPPTPPDSLKQTVHIFNKGGQALIQVLQGVDSLQDSVTIKEVSDRYDSLLKEEKINVGFQIDRKELVMRNHTVEGDVAGGFTRRAEITTPDFEEDNQATVGFFRPITFTMSLNETGSYLLKRLSVPILVSFLLVGLTIISFVLMWRTLVQQKRLAQFKNEFVSNITHELKTPIATVGVAIEALRNFNAINDPARTKEYLDISAAEVHRLGLLVDKVLKLSMFENKEIGLQKESFDFLQLVQEVLASMKLQFEKQDAKVSLETNGVNFIIEADKLHITSVVYNLLDNALKYSKGQPVIDVFIKSHAEHVSLSVTDKGVGIPKEYKGKIFEKFFRIPGGDRHNIKGYGLGLSYVNHIVQKHQGFVEVKSEPGAGSTFTANIPYKEADIVRFDEHRTIRRESLKA